MQSGIPSGLTKHEQILYYIEQLPYGRKISVRGLAKELEVSEGTAYRAIKDAETRGIVSTQERIGTVRIEKPSRDQEERLTFADVLHMVDGKVLGGAEGLTQPLNKFVIGAMEKDAMMQYIEPGSLLIVGNRYDAHQAALDHGAAVLVTGGFDTDPDMKRLADDKRLPVISSTHDTFTVASLINRAMFDRLIKKKIILVEDLLLERKGTEVATLRIGDAVGAWKRKYEETGHSRFPVVDEKERVVGMVTSKDVVSAEEEQAIEKVMTPRPNTVRPHTSIASAAHMMVWEGIELLPVIDPHRKLIGVISRKDVLQAMQYIQKQPQIGETFEELVWSGMSEERTEGGEIGFRGRVSPQMASPLGTVSEGVLATLMTKAAYYALQGQKKGDLVLENIAIYYVRPLQIETDIEIVPRMIELSRKFAKCDIELSHADGLVCKAMMTAQWIDPL